MSQNDFDDFDALIEEALKSEAQLSLPFGFQRRVEERLRVAALLDGERRRFSYCLKAAMTLCIVLVSSAASLAFFNDLPSLLLHNIPGGLGLYDQVSVFLAIWWPGLVGTSVVAVCVFAISLLCLEVLPARKMSPATN